MTITENVNCVYFNIVHISLIYLLNIAHHWKTIGYYLFTDI